MHMDHGKKKWRKDVDKKRLQLPENMNKQKVYCWAVVVELRLPKGPAKPTVAEGVHIP